MRLRHRIVALAFTIGLCSLASAQQAVTTSTTATSDVIVTGEEVGGEEMGPEKLEMRLMKLNATGHHPTVRRQDEGDEGDFERRSIPDGVEGRLLLAQDFGEHVEWALNGFIEQEVEGDRGREI